VDQRLGFKAAVKLLRGEEDERLTRYGLSSATAFGTLASRSEAWVSLLLQRCVSAGWVDFTQGEYQLLMLTAAGRAVLEGKRPARLMLPSIDAGRKERGAKSGRVRERATRAATPGKEPLESPEYTVRFERLRRWRLETSRLGSVPAFVVASDRTLQDIASTNPRSLDELRLCYGIGPAKLDLYGPSILEVLRGIG
jgi:ATP-dependent DNA helicase RecQ